MRRANRSGSGWPCRSILAHERNCLRPSRGRPTLRNCRQQGSPKRYLPAVGFFCALGSPRTNVEATRDPEAFHEDVNGGAERAKKDDDPKPVRIGPPADEVNDSECLKD